MKNLEPTQSTVLKYASVAVFWLGLVISGWFLLVNLVSLKWLTYLFSIIFIAGIFLLLKIFKASFTKKVSKLLIGAFKNRFLILPVTIFSGIAVRLFFYVKYQYTPTSDPGRFFEAAQNIAGGTGLAGNDYVAFFPFLAAYNNILGLAMKMIPDSWLAVILLNLMFDLSSALIIFLLMKKISKPDSAMPALGFTLWLLSPFNIIFSVQALPVAATNFFIISLVFAVYVFYQNIIINKTVPVIISALILGIIIGLGNCFRPVFPVAVIAFILFCILILFNKFRRKSAALCVLSILIIIGIYTGIGKINFALISSQTDLKPAKNPNGWSVYVGSNYEYAGSWNDADAEYQRNIFEVAEDNDERHTLFRQAGFERYKKHGFGGTLSLFVRKLYMFSANQSEMYNADHSIPGYYKSAVSRIIDFYTLSFIIIICFLSARFMYLSAKSISSGKKNNVFIIFLTLLLNGFFFSAMLFEVSLRYAQIMYPLFVCFALLSFVKYPPSLPRE